MKLTLVLIGAAIAFPCFLQTAEAGGRHNRVELRHSSCRPAHHRACPPRYRMGYERSFPGFQWDYPTYGDPRFTWGYTIPGFPELKWDYAGYGWDRSFLPRHVVATAVPRQRCEVPHPRAKKR